MLAIDVIGYSYVVGLPTKFVNRLGLGLWVHVERDRMVELVLLQDLTNFYHCLRYLYLDLL